MIEEAERLDWDDLVFVGAVVRVVRQSIVHDLLESNPRQSFTTEEYRTAYRQATGGSAMSPELARTHLESLADVLCEVAPAVWAPIRRME